MAWPVRRAQKKKEGEPVNKKVRNATAVEIDGTKFRSKLEGFMYTLLKRAGVQADYEQHKFVIFPGFTWNGKKYLPITYTPDFVNHQKKFIIECKGFANEVFPYKMKLFLKWMLDNGMADYRYYLVKNQKECQELIKLLA